jgi:anthranilate synthase component 1
MIVKDGVAYLQAGEGIVFDSDPYDEYIETLNKLGANIPCIKVAEERCLKLEAEKEPEVENGHLPLRV